MFYILYLLQVIADSAHVVHIVYIELYLSFEDTVVGFDGQFTDIHVELAGDDLSYFVQQSHAVYTFYIYSDEERQILVRETSTVEVPVYRRPSITGKNFGNENELFVELNKGTEQEFWIATSSILTKALVSCDQFTSLGLPVNSFDILAMNAEDKSLFSSYGVNIVSKYNVNTGQGNTKIGLSEAFMQKLSQKEGVYDIQINATYCRPLH